jgi:hypothetical protein
VYFNGAKSNNSKSLTSAILFSRILLRRRCRLTRRVPLVEQELLTLPEHLSSPAVFNGIRVTRSLVLYVCFVDRCLSFCTFSFGHCVVCSSSIYGFWLSLWYLQTLLKDMLDCAQKYLLLLDQTILLHLRSSIDRPLNLPQYPGSNNYFSIPEENI